MIKKAFLIVGPESSGTRITTQLFTDSYCWGSCEHYQILDAAVKVKDIDEIKRLTKNSYFIVFRQSVPHGSIWPDLIELQKLFQDADFNVLFIFTMRDFVINNIVTCRTHANTKESQMMIRWRHILKFLPGLSNFCFFSTSFLFCNPKEAIKNLSLLVNYHIYSDLESLIRSTYESLIEVKSV